MGQVIDTSVFVTMERRELGLASLLAASPVPGEEVFLSSFTVSELLAGFHTAPLGSRRQQMEAFLEAILETIPILPFGLREARAYGLLWAQLLASGQKIKVFDALIAATALSNGHGIITEDLSRFQRVPGLAVVSPRWT